MTKKQEKKISVKEIEHHFIREKEKAIAVGVECLRHNEKIRQQVPSIPSVDAYKFPEEANQAPFEISEIALKNTMDYIYDILSHPCYMLCIQPTRRVLYKLEQTKTSPLFQKMAKEELERVKWDLPFGDWEHISDTLRQPFRIMQCIVKPQAKKESFSQEYLEWLGSMADSLPFGVFILNLTDAVILRKDGLLPFPKQIPLPTPIQTPVLPIFSTSGQQGYWDIPIPNYDDIGVVMDGNDTVWNTDWMTKKVMAVFRGGPTGCGTRAETNARLAVAQLNSPLLDAGIVSGESRSVRFDPKYGLSTLSATDITPVGKLTMEEQSHYKYIVHIDGNVLAYRLLTTMLSGSLILRIKSPYVSWIDHYIQPNQHYIEVNGPEDLLSKIEWCKKNDDICQRIALRGRLFAERVLTRRFQTGYFTGLLWNAVQGKDRHCLPWDRQSSSFSKLRKTAKSTTKEKFVPAFAPQHAPLKKTKKTKKTKKRATHSSPPLEQQPVVSEPRSSPPHPSSNLHPYRKQTEKEKCRKGFVTDRKDKLLCVPGKKTVATKPATPENPSVIVLENDDDVPEQEPVVEQEVVEKQPYMKREEKEKCRKGFVTDRKNKMRCVPK